MPVQTILFPAHGGLVAIYAEFAREIKARRGIESVIVVQGTKDARRARRWNAFAEIVDVAADLQLSKSDANASRNLRALAAFEQKYGEASVWQAIIQDRQWGVKQYSYNEILEYVSHSVRSLETIFSRWDILAVIGELTQPIYRLAFQMCGTTRPYLVPMTARFFDRTYFDDDIYLQWRECIRIYQRFMLDGVPEDIGTLVDPVIQGIRAGRVRPVYMDRNIAISAKYSGLQKVRPAVWAIWAKDIWYNNIIDGPKNPQGLHWSYWLPPRRVARWAQWTFRRRYYHQNTVRKIPQNTRFALYLPHWQPEYTIDVQGWPFVDQASLIRNIAQSLPADMLLLVKEHRFMLGPRSVEFYRRILELPNVRLMDEMTNSQELVGASELVFTVTGTVTLEALCYGKPVIMFGRVFLNELQGVKVVRDLYSLPGEVESSLNGEGINYDQSVRAALAAMYVSSYPGGIDVELLEPGDSSQKNQALLGRALEMELMRRGILSSGNQMEPNVGVAPDSLHPDRDVKRLSK